MRSKFKSPEVGDYLILYGECQDKHVLIPYRVIKCEIDTHPSCGCANPKNHYLLDLQFNKESIRGIDHYDFCPCNGLDWNLGAFVPKYFIVDKIWFKRFCSYIDLFRNHAKPVFSF